MLTHIDGAPALMNSEKSSLGVLGGDGLSLSPNAAFSTFSAVATTPGSFITALAPSVILISGAGASDMAAAAFAVRPIPASSWARTPGLQGRGGPHRRPARGIEFCAVPPWLAPLDTTPNVAELLS